MAERTSKVSLNPDDSEQIQRAASLTGEDELASRTLHIQSKRFYLDVKQNRRGRFLKIAEVSAGGRKSRILMSMNVASELSMKLQIFIDEIQNLGEFNANNRRSTDDGRLQSAVLVRDDRKYYLDLKENDRGRFLRISMIGSNTARTQIALPAQGLQELQRTLLGLLEEYGNEDDKDSIESPAAIDPEELPENKYLRVGNKQFYFDIGSNNRGIYLRISEVRGNFRSAITIPEKAWPRFRDNIDDFIVAMTNERNIIPNSASIERAETSPTAASGGDAKK